MLAERLGIDDEDEGDVGLGDAIAGHRLELPAALRIGPVGSPAHAGLPSPGGSGTVPVPILGTVEEESCGPVATFLYSRFGEDQQKGLGES